MKGQVILSIFHNRIGPGRILEKDIFKTSAWNRTKTCQKHVFLVAESRQENLTVVICYLLYSTVVMCYLLYNPLQWEVVSLHTRHWKMLGSHYQVSWSQFRSPGNSVLPPSGRPQTQQAGCWNSVWTWLWLRLWFGSHPYRALLPAM